MPVKKSGDKYSVNNEEYDTQEKANQAYMSYIGKAMGVKEGKDEMKGQDKKKETKKPKKKK